MNTTKHIRSLAALTFLALTMGCDGDNLIVSDIGPDSGTEPDARHLVADAKVMGTPSDNKPDAKAQSDAKRDTLAPPSCNASVLKSVVGIEAPSGPVDWLNFDSVKLSDYGCEGVGSKFHAGTYGGYGAVDNPLVNQVFVAVTDNEKVLSSIDGRVWTERYSNPSFHITTATHQAVFWSDVAQKFLIGGQGSAPGYEILSSSDGMKWSNSAAEGSILAFAESDSLIVAAGDIGGFYTSVDGVLWTLRPFSAFIVVSMAWNGSVFVAMSVDGSRAVSSDGIAWKGMGEPNNVPSTARRGLVWDGKQFIATGGNGSGTRETSHDGVTWTLEPPTVDYDGIAISIEEMLVEGGVIYGVTHQRTSLARSTDGGATWDRQRLEAGFGEGMFIGGGRLVTLGSINGTPGLLLGHRTATR